MFGDGFRLRMPYRRTETFPGADHGGQQKICLKRHEMKDLSKKNGDSMDKSWVRHGLIMEFMGFNQHKWRYHGYNPSSEEVRGLYEGTWEGSPYTKHI